MRVRDEGWSVGALAHPTIEAERVEPVRTAYRVRDEQLIPLLDEGQPKSGARGFLAQSFLEFGDGLAGMLWGLLRLPFILAAACGILGVFAMAFMWLITQSEIAVRNGLLCVGLIVFCYAVQFVTFKIQAACSRWVAKGAR